MMPHKTDKDTAQIFSLEVEPRNESQEEKQWSEPRPHNIKGACWYKWMSSVWGRLISSFISACIIYYMNYSKEFALQYLSGVLINTRENVLALDFYTHREIEWVSWQLLAPRMFCSFRLGRFGSLPPAKASPPPPENNYFSTMRTVFGRLHFDEHLSILLFVQAVAKYCSRNMPKTQKRSQDLNTYRVGLNHIVQHDCKQGINSMERAFASRVHWKSRPPHRRVTTSIEFVMYEVKSVSAVEPFARQLRRPRQPHVWKQRHDLICSWANRDPERKITREVLRNKRNHNRPHCCVRGSCKQNVTLNAAIWSGVPDPDDLISATTDHVS